MDSGLAAARRPGVTTADEPDVIGMNSN